MAERKKPTTVKHERKRSKPLKVRTTFDHSGLPPVICEGILQASVGSELLVSRQVWKKVELHRCSLTKIDAEKGYLEMYDSTVQQMYVVSLKEKLPEVFKIIKHGVEAAPPSVSSVDPPGGPLSETSASMLQAGIKDIQEGYVVTLDLSTLDSD